MGGTWEHRWTAHANALETRIRRGTNNPEIVRPLFYFFALSTLYNTHFFVVEQKTAIAVLTGNKCTLNSAKILCITIILQGKKTLLQIPTTLLQQYYGCTTAIFRSTELQYLQVTTGHYRSLQVTTVTTGHYRFREKVTEFADGYGSAYFPNDRSRIRDIGGTLDSELWQEIYQYVISIWLVQQIIIKFLVRFIPPPRKWSWP